MEEMKVYIGAKIILACPMDQETFLANYRKGEGKNEEVDGKRSSSPVAKGYLVKYEDGYYSWSPTEAFERAYRLVSSGEKGLMEI